MNNEEPELTPAANVQVSTTGHKLPEQARVASCSIPRGISILNLIHQWQPMGIRVIVNLPFTGNDQDFLFLIRNGPFIPRWDHVFDDKYRYRGNIDSDSKVKLPTDKNLCSYAWNNMRNVFHAFQEKKNFPKDFPVTITQYDYPPPISTFAMAFRRWRGDMQYRVRTVAGFATQGYLIAMPIKNAWMPIGVYNEYETVPVIPMQDKSYREHMMNSYIMADTSMFRHLEITYPYEYPCAFYDQFMWMARRYSPVPYAAYQTSDTSTPRDDPIQYEPHGDNFLAFGLRGNLAATQAGAQIEFELEYRCVEGFQFADPGLVPYQFSKPRSTPPHGEPNPVLKRIPDDTMESDGIGIPKKKTSSMLQSAGQYVAEQFAALSTSTTTTTTTPAPEIFAEKITPAPPVEAYTSARRSHGRHKHSTTTENPEVARWYAERAKLEAVREQQERMANYGGQSDHLRTKRDNGTDVIDDRETKSLGRREKEFSY